MTGAEILENVLIYSKLNIKKLSERIGLDRPQALYDIQNGKTKNISSSMSYKIYSVFSEINLNWLLTGKGEMLNNNVSDTLESSNSRESDTNISTISIIDRNSKSIEKMVEIADRNSMSIKQLVDSNMKLIDLLCQNGIVVSDETQKGGNSGRKKNNEDKTNNEERFKAG